MKKINELMNNELDKKEIKTESIDIASLKPFLGHIPFTVEHENGLCTAGISINGKAGIYNLFTDEEMMINHNYVHLRSFHDNINEKFMQGKVKCLVCGDTGYQPIALNELIHIKGTDYLVKQGALEKVRCKYCDISNSNPLNMNNFRTTYQWQKDAKNVALSFIEDLNHLNYWFYFSGQVGSGKTHLSYAIANELKHKFGYEIVIKNWMELATFLKENTNTKSYSNEISYLSKVKVLVIDDLFKNGNKEKPTTADNRIAMQILNKRYEAKLITIINSEFSLGEIINNFDSAYSRIYEMSKNGSYIFHINNDPKKNIRMNPMKD